MPVGEMAFRDRVEALRMRKCQGKALGNIHASFRNLDRIAQLWVGKKSTNTKGIQRTLLTTHIGEGYCLEVVLLRTQRECRSTSSVSGQLISDRYSPIQDQCHAKTLVFGRRRRIYVQHVHVISGTIAHIHHAGWVVDDAR